MKPRKITPEQVKKIKGLVKSNTTRVAARRAGVSQHTVMRVIQGKFDKETEKKVQSRCPITGFKM